MPKRTNALLVDIRAILADKNLAPKCQRMHTTARRDGSFRVKFLCTTFDSRDANTVQTELNRKGWKQLTYTYHRPAWQNEHYNHSLTFIASHEAH